MVTYLHFGGYALIAMAAVYAVWQGAWQASHYGNLISMGILDWLSYPIGIVRFFAASCACWRLSTFGFLALWASLYFAKS